MARIRIPTVLRPLAEGRAIIEVEAASVGALREAIRVRHPDLAARLYDGDGRVREFVSLFIDGEDANGADDTRTLADRSEIVLLPAISGGA